MTWNHNTHYHQFLLKSVPAGCRHAVDVGCGDGEFARRVATRSGSVLAIDSSAEMIDRAKLLSSSMVNVTFVQANFMDYHLKSQSCDFLSAIAVLHHLPFAEAINKMKAAVRPGGLLAILGLFRETRADFARSLLAVGANTLYLRRVGIGDSTDGPVIPTAEPTMMLAQIRASLDRLLPDATFRRHLFWRYSVIWRNTGL